jgi:subtilisin family serine protease
MHTRRLQHRLLGVLAAALIVTASVPAATQAAAERADGYIVVLREGASSDKVAREQAARYGFDVQQLYSSALTGYAASFSEDVAKRLSADPDVAYVSPDFTVQAPPQPGLTLEHIPPQFFNLQWTPRGVSRVGASTDGKTQTLANDGAGIGVAVIDTGIQMDHPDLKPVQNGKNCLNPALTAADDAGHGTHVAGTIAARDNNIGVVGVAPAANLFAVKVLNSAGSGTWSQVICGIDWVTANAAAKGIRVANMSLGGWGTVTPSNADCSNGNADALHTAICNSVKAGITYVVAAGNSSANASGFVPAGYDEVIAVSAWSDTNGAPDATGASYTCAGWGVQTDETWATGTNYGSVVDIAAPGVGIRSTMMGSTYGYMCGTSMASPHVSGAAALALKKWPGLSPSSVKTVLKALASPLADTVQHTENLLNVSGL